jgi:integrase
MAAAQPIAKLSLNVTGLRKSNRDESDRLLISQLTGQEIVGHPHMFRHTFAVRPLVAGTPVEDVATLMGHSDGGKTVVKYYCCLRQRASKSPGDSVRKTWALDTRDGYVEI